MRVIHINDKLSVSGGVEVYITQLLKLQRERGYAAIWLAINQNGKNVRIFEHGKGMVWSGHIGELERLEYLSQATQHTIFHVHSLSEPDVLDCLFRMAPVVRTMHEPRMVCPGQGKFWARSERPCKAPFGAHCIVRAYTEKCCNRHPMRLLNQFANTKYETKTAFKKYSAILANSTYSKELLDELGLVGEHVRVCPYFAPLVEDSHRFEENAKKVVFVGRLSRTKGVHHLIRSFAVVQSEVPDATLEIYGSGNHQTQFERLVEELKLSDFVAFHGWADRDTVDRAIGEAAIVAVPSVYPEAFGIVGIEAMMQAKPVVAFDVGGVSDWLEDGRTGFALPSKDWLAMSKKLVDLLSNANLRQEMGAAALEKARKDFAPNVHMESLETVYTSILHQFECH